nr:rhodanese-like domain-containing protein [Flavihumibacter rivuli]
MNELLTEPTATVVDVRNDWEYEMEHYPGAINIPLDQIMNRIDEFQQLGKPIVLYCRSSNRSGLAQMILQQAGVTETYNGGALSALPKPVMH